MAFYISYINQYITELRKLSNYIVVDAFFAKHDFSKHSFVDNILQNTDFNSISRLRDDAVLLYQYTGPTTDKRGRPQVYDGKVNVKNPSLNHLSIAYEDDQIRIFSGVVYVKSLQRKIKIAITHYLEANKSKIKAVKIYFCTDINLSAWHIVKIYKLRFQIEAVRRCDSLSRRQSIHRLGTMSGT